MLSNYPIRNNKYPYKMADIRTTVMEDINTTSPPPDVSVGVSVGLVSAIILLIIFIIIIIQKCRDQKSRRGSDIEDSEGSALPQDGILTLDKIVRQHSIGSGADTDYWNKIDPKVKKAVGGILINGEKLTIGRILGKGQFGCVYEGALAKDSRCSNDYGQLTHEKVAVKTLRCTGGSNLDPDTVEAFLREGMIMKDFSHPNVLTLLGVTLGESGIPMIVLPYMANGNLKKYISNLARVLLVRDLLEYGRQVARGMKYLAEQKFVHRDLAARNCMLDSEGTVKVADFGLSRDIYTRDYYCSEDKQVKLPVKWMALESLSTSKYSSKTDVWSFGVLLWELLTRGATPYPDVSNWDVWRYIKAGRRMRQPDSCPDEVYDLMKRCWRESAERRPTFQAIVVELDAMMAHDEEEGLDDVDGSPDYMNLYQSVEAPDEIDQENTGPM